MSGPNGFAQDATFRNARPRRETVVATYRIEAPGGRWDAADAGTYTIALRPDQTRSQAGVSAAGRDLFGSFRVV